MRKASANDCFASGEVTCKFGALCFYSNFVLVESFVIRKPLLANLQPKFHKQISNKKNKTVKRGFTDSKTT